MVGCDRLLPIGRPEREEGVGGGVERVNADGTLRSSSHRDITSEEYPPFPDTGTYVVTFPFDVSDCAFSVTPADDYVDRFVQRRVANL